MISRKYTILFTLGMAFYWPLFVYQIFPPSLFVPSLANQELSNDYRFYLLTFVVVFSIALAILRRLTSISELRFLSLLIISCVLYALTTLLFISVELHSTVFYVLFWLNLIAFALMVVVLTMLWAYFSQKLDNAKFRRYLPLSMLISVILGSLLQLAFLAAQWGETTFTSVFPVLSCVLLLYLNNSSSESSFHTPDTQPLPFRTLVANSYFIAFSILVLYLLSSGVYYGVLTQGVTYSSMQGLPHKVILILLVLAVCIFLRHSAKKDTMYAYPLTFFITLCIVALYCVALFGSIFSEICRMVVLPTRACAIFLAWMVVGEVARQNKSSFSILLVELFLPLITFSWMVVLKVWDLWSIISAHDYSDLVMLGFALLSALILMLSTFKFLNSKTPTIHNSSGDSSDLDLDAKSKIVIDELRESYKLSVRETEVLALLSEGHTKKRISEILLLSVNSVQTYSKSLYVKLGVHNRQEILDLVKDRKSKRLH